MTLPQIAAAASALPASERLQLIELLWETLDPEAESAPFLLTAALETELSRRLAALEANPRAGRPWREIRDELLSQSPS
jgi:putative addiction module component (TIGR02574 family)